MKFRTFSEANFKNLLYLSRPLCIWWQHCQWRCSEDWGIWVFSQGQDRVDSSWPSASMVSKGTSSTWLDSAWGCFLFLISARIWRDLQLSQSGSVLLRVSCKDTTTVGFSRLRNVWYISNTQSWRLSAGLTWRQHISAFLTFTVSAL